MRTETTNPAALLEPAETLTPGVAATSVNPLIRLFPSLSDVAFLMPIGLALGIRGASGMLEGDTGWHIRTGQWILEHGSVPRVDMFSFTQPGKQWFAWEWLWDLIFGWLHLHWGMSAVVMGSLLALCCVSLLVFRLTLRHCENRIIAIVVTFLAMAASVVHWSARPHLYTLLFLAIFYSILERAKDGRAKLLWLLPVLTVPWANLHCGFFVGIALICGYAAGDLIHAAVTPERSERTARISGARRYLLVAAVCVLASLANPYGYHLHRFILTYLNNPFEWLNISEYQSLSFHGTSGRFWELLLLAAIAATLWSLFRKRYTQALLLAACTHLALVAGRNVPLLAIVAAPAIGQAAEEWFATVQAARCAGWLRRSVEGLQEMMSEFSALDRIRRFHLVSAAALLGVILLFRAPSPLPAFQAAYMPELFPVKAVQFLEGHQLTTRVFTSDWWGSYLIYQLYPRGQAFIDGRFDSFYDDRIDNAFLEINKASYGWERQLDEYRIETVLLPVQAILASVLKESRRWKPVYDDGVAIVFRRSVPPGVSDSHTSSIGATLPKWATAGRPQLTNLVSRPQ